MLAAFFSILPVGVYEARNPHPCNEHAAGTMFWASIPDYLGVVSASRSVIMIFLLFLLQGLPGIPGKRGEMGRPVKIFRVYYTDSTGSPTSRWLYCTGGP